MEHLKNVLFENNKVRKINVSIFRFLGVIKGCIANYIKNSQTKYKSFTW